MATLTEEIAIKLGISTSTFNTALQEADATLKKTKASAEDTSGGIAELGNALKGFFALVAGSAVVSFARDLLASADALDQQAENLEINVEKLQAFQLEIKSSNGSIEDANKILATARLKLDELRAGNEQVTDAFAALGLAAKDFVGLSLDRSLERIAKAYGENADRAGAYAALQEIVGKGGNKLMDVLVALGKDGLDPLVKKWKDTGAVVDEVTNKQLAEANKKVDGFLATAKAWGSATLAALIDAGGFIADVFAAESQWEQGLKSAKIATDYLAQSTYTVAELQQMETKAVNETRESLVKTAAQKKQEADDERLYKQELLAWEDKERDRAKELVQLNAKLRDLEFERLTPAEQVVELRAQERLYQQALTSGMLDILDFRDAEVKLIKIQAELQKLVSGQAKEAAENEQKKADAAKKAADELERQAKALSNLYATQGLKAGGGPITDLSDIQLQSLRATVQQQLTDAIREDSQYSGFGTPIGTYKSPIQYQLQQQLDSIRKEQDKRYDFAQTLAAFGSKYAEQHYAPSEFERLMQIINPDLVKKQASDIQTITRILGTLVGGNFYAGYTSTGLYTTSSSGAPGTFSNGDPYK